MYMAEPVVEDKMLLRYLFRYKMRQIVIRNKIDIFIRKRLHNLQCVRRCHADIRVGFQFCGRIDIADNRHFRIFPAYFLDLLDFRHMCHRTIRSIVCHIDVLFGIQKLCALPHKGDTAKQNILLFYCRCNLCKIV